MAGQRIEQDMKKLLQSSIKTYLRIWPDITKLKFYDICVSFFQFRESLKVYQYKFQNFFILKAI